MPKLVTEMEPNLIGLHGFAWKHNQDFSDRPHATLITWIIKAAYAHPVWDFYALSLIHLRPVKDLPQAKILLTDATHEIYLAALDPDKIPFIDAQNVILSPLNYAGQFISENDEAALKKVEETVVDIINGVLSPDTDYVSMWIQRFGNSNYKK